MYAFTRLMTSFTRTIYRHMMLSSQLFKIKLICFGETAWRTVLTTDGRRSRAAPRCYLIEHAGTSAIEAAISFVMPEAAWFHEPDTDPWFLGAEKIYT